MPTVWLLTVLLFTSQSANGYQQQVASEAQCRAMGQAMERLAAEQARQTSARQTSAMWSCEALPPLAGLPAGPAAPMTGGRRY